MIATAFVAVIISLATVGVASAWASTEVLVNEPFTGSTMSSSDWTLPSAPSGANVACLTAGTSTSEIPVPGCGLTPPDSSGSGALRLTANSGGEEGGVAYSLTVPTVDGIDAKFDSYQYGTNSGADGIGFFLAAANPAEPKPPAAIGQPGGALGYSAVGAGSSGMTYGYLGIGLDVYGNYANTSYEGTGCTNPSWDSGTVFPNEVSVRGPGNGSAGYCMLASTASGGGMSGTLDGGAAGTRTSSIVPVEVAINPLGATVVTASGLSVPPGSYVVAFTPIGSSRQTVTGTLPSVAGLGFPASWYNPATGIPYQLTFGWVGSTGGDKEVHEVNNVQAGTVSGIPPTLTASVTDNAGGAPAHASTFDYDVAVANQTGTQTDPGPITVTDVLPAGVTPSSTGLGGSGWSCSISGQTVTCTYSGSLASGASLPTLPIPATVTASQGTQLTDTATASSDDSDPATAKDTVTVATPPTDTSTCGTAGGANGWFVTDPTCTVQGTDSNPGVDHVSYQLDSAAVVTTSSGTTTASVPITTDGTHTLKTEIFNASGQNSGWRTQTIKVDTTPPADTSTCGTPNGQNGYFVTDPTCTVQGTDSVSGVDHIAYKLDSGIVTTTSSGTTTASVPITTDGTHTLMSEIFNAAGLNSGWRTQTIKVDTTPPIDTSSCGVPDGANGWFVTAPTCTVSATDANGIAQVQYQLDSGATQSGTSGTTLSVPDGTHSLSTRAQDDAGNWSAWRTQSVNVDTTPPSDTSTCGTPDGQNGYFVTDPTCTVQGTDAISGVDHVAYQLDSGSVITTTSGTTTASVPITTDGTHTLKTEIFNAAGLNSGWSTQTIKVDTTAPIDTSTCGIPDGANGWFVTAPTCTVSATDADGVAQVQYQLDSGAIQSGASGATVSIPNGTHSLSTRAQDDAGNWSAWRSQSVNVDTTPPADTSTCGTPNGQNGYFVTDPTCTVQGTDSISGVDHVAYQLDSGSVITTTSGTTTASVPITTDGTHTLMTEIFNAAGLTSGWTTQTIKVDTATPATPSVTSPANGSTSNNTSPTVTISGTPGDSATVDVDGTTYGPVTLDGLGNGQIQIPGPLSDGQHQVRVEQTDVAGTTSSWSAYNIWTIKTSTNVSLSGPTSGPINDTTPTVTYTGEVGDDFTITVDGQLVATGVIPVGGSGLLTLPNPLSDGSHTVVITATDIAGNEATASIVITVDTVAPGVSIVGAPAEFTPSSDATFSFTATKPSVSYQCSLDGGAWTACPSPVTFTGLAQGPHTLLVRGTDTAGNVSPSAEYTWTVQTTPPAPPVILGGPNAITTPGPAQFNISPQPGVTLQCSVDGGPYVPCSTLYNLQALPVGSHVLDVRAVDEAGNVSAPATYTWTVLKRTGPAGLPRSARLLIATPATVNAGPSLDVGCNLNAGSMRRCQVTAYYHDTKVGTGVTVEHRRGHTHTIVVVMLNARGRRLLERADGGLPLRLLGSAKPFGFSKMAPRTRTIVFEPLEFVLPDVLFNSRSSTLTPAAHAIVTGIAREITGARRVVCDGNTDARGGVAYNYELGMRRAEAVCRLLRTLGLNAQYRAVSYGMDRPVVPNTTPQDMHLNRRVVIHVSFHDLGGWLTSVKRG